MPARRIPIHYAIPLVAIPLAVLWAQYGYGGVRHQLSWVGGILVLLAASYTLRIHWLKWGQRRTWLSFHRPLALTGAGLIVTHTALSPQSWHAQIALAAVALAAGSGVWANTRKGESRRRWRRFHFVAMPILLGSMILHGVLRPRHDAYFPLNAAYHQVTCSRCHNSDRSYRTNGCLGCHPHNDPDLMKIHTLHGISEAEYRPCLNCHTTTVDGIRYGKPRAPGHAVINWLVD